ncbi:MAG: hypothetical protein ACRDGA_11245, partial [Bacteroidota bacterium]
LIEADFINTSAPSSEQVKFWLEESRTPDMLVAIAGTYLDETEMTLPHRSLLEYARQADLAALDLALDEEQREERENDRKYWEPLRKQLEQLRLSRLPPEEEV